MVLIATGTAIVKADIVPSGVGHALVLLKFVENVISLKNGTDMYATLQRPYVMLWVLYGGTGVTIDPVGI